MKKREDTDHDELPTAKRRRGANSKKKEEVEVPLSEALSSSIIAQFQNMEGETVGPEIDTPLCSTRNQLEMIVNSLLGEKEHVPYAFYIGDKEVTDILETTVLEQSISTELILPIRFQPLSIFRVRPVTRCTDTLPGHTEAILHVSFSPDGTKIGTGGGDTTVRFWDVNTGTPLHTCKGHSQWVLATAWSPDGTKFASADKSGELRIWDPKNGLQIGPPMKRHKQWINSIAWEPMHRNAACERIATASKDKTVLVWNIRTRIQEFCISGHSDSIECVKWGGEGLLYTASRDRTIKVWAVDNGEKGKLVRTLTGHAHRVNKMALSTDCVNRSGPFAFGLTVPKFESQEAAFEASVERYNKHIKDTGAERLASASDDLTVILWEPVTSKTPILRMTGHAQPVMDVSFSPDGRFLASAGFDKKIKLWDGRTGTHMHTLHGHVGAVYMVCWSPDSRWLVSASKDSSVKLWTVKGGKVHHDLPGHEDEVYALDWSPNGARLASGSKDRTLKIWRN